MIETLDIALIWICLPIILAVILSRRYLQEILGSSRTTATQVVAISIIYTGTVFATGAADVGTIAAIIVLLTSTSVIYPVYTRDRRIGQESNYGILSYVIGIVLMGGLFVFPTPAVLTGLSETKGMLTLYSIIGGCSAVLGRLILKSLDRASSK